jgi:hypothetical protein
MDRTEQGVTFYAKINAHDLLVRLLVFECQRRDPQFAERCRQQLDRALGMMLSELPIEGPVSLEIREQIKVKERETIREILEVAEKATADLERGSAQLREAGLLPLTWRRRILNWFERG